MGSYDVVNLYTCIPTEETIKIICDEAFSKRNSKHHQILTTRIKKTVTKTITHRPNIINKNLVSSINNKNAKNTTEKNQNC